MSDITTVPFDYIVIGYRDLMLEVVKVLPSADRPRGEWIDAEIPLESGGIIDGKSQTEREGK